MVREAAVVAAMSLACLSSAEASETQLFEQITTVLTHPRCLNCHTSVDHPKQGDDRHRHLMYVQRGADGHGAPGMRCSTCHQKANDAASGVPGAPNWHLAPLSMSWENKDSRTLCRALLARKTNGNRSVAELVDHMANDPLVAWGWTPGADRKPIPVAKEEFVSLLKRWADAGAPCPR